jgi:conjugative transfer signal peptidase TraF
MRCKVLTITNIMVSTGVFLLVLESPKWLIWNRTASAPIGLYWVSNAPPSIGCWGVVSAESEVATWSREHGFIGKDWPLIKLVSGLEGDEICRHNERISINGVNAARAHSIDRYGRSLPSWSGCFKVTRAQAFLLSSHPESLDGRYFGATDLRNIEGRATLVFKYSDHSAVQSKAALCKRSQSG